MFSVTTAEPEVAQVTLLHEQMNQEICTKLATLKYLKEQSGPVSVTYGRSRTLHFLLSPNMYFCYLLKYLMMIEEEKNVIHTSKYVTFNQARISSTK